MAQQLKVETKTLVDAIKSMGIDGKGSPLASLTEDEVKTIKANFQKTASKPNTSGLAGNKEGQSLRHVLPSEVPVKKIPVIGNTQGNRKKDEPQKETPEITTTQKNDNKDHAKDHTKDHAKTHADAAKQPAKSTAAQDKTTSDVLADGAKVDKVKSVPVEKSAVTSHKVNAADKSGLVPDAKNISVTKKESGSSEPATSHKTPPSTSASTVHGKHASKVESKESAQKNAEPHKTTHSQKQSAHAGTSTTSTQQPKNSPVGKVVEKEVPKLPPAIGHIDISTISGSGRSNQYRGGGGGSGGSSGGGQGGQGQGGGSKSSGNHDSRNRSNSPLNHYLKKGGGGRQQQQQNSGSQRQQSQNQNQYQQQQKQGQNQRQFQNHRTGANQQVQQLKKPSTGTFDTNSDAFNRNDNYWKRPPIDNKIPDLDGKRKRPDGDLENKNDNRFPQENRQDTNRQQTGQNNKKPQAVNIFLAPIPTVKTKRQPKEPQAQKPDKRLPTDVIRQVLTSGSGSSVDAFILKHKEKQHEKETARRERDSGKRGGGNFGKDRNQSTQNDRGRGRERPNDRGIHENNRRMPHKDDHVVNRGGAPVDRGGNKGLGVRQPDGGNRGVRPRLERDKHHTGRLGSDGAPKPDTPFNDTFDRPFGRRDSSVVAEEKRRTRVKKRSRRNEFDDETSMNLPRQLKRVKSRDGKAVSTAAPRKSNLVIHLPCSVKQFAEQTGTTLAVVIKKLLELGIQMQLNSQLDVESVELLADSLGIQVLIKENVSLEDRLVTTLFEQADEPEMLKPRPPVVTVLGHVDHGKTTMLDNILKLNVVSGEKGGITQHIRAYRVKMENGEDITFVDTPGHEAFTEMRARGAGCTDIAVLVVAADDGVMPQTEEAISHAKAAGVPIIVAINKMDLPGMNIDRVIQELAVNDLLPEEWGGDVPIVRCSGLTGMGLDKLLETIQLMAEMHELKANPNRAAIGVALEAELQSGQGAVCKVIVQNGTLRTGDIVLCGTAYGRVKAMYDTLDTKKQIYEATASTPVNLVGLDVAPGAGSRFCVLDDISDARIIAEQRQVELRKNELAEVQSHVTLETLYQRIKDSHSVQTLNVIIRADVRGSIEAIRKELSKLSHPEVKIKILQATVGGISEADVHLADASDAIIVGFNVVPDENARMMADRKKIQVRRYDIIYNLTDDIRKALEGMLRPVEHVKELGRALVQQVFAISRLGTIAGCKVTSGIIERDCKIRVIHDSRIIGEYPLDSLKREKDDVKEIREGFECGIKLKGFNDLKTGDVLEAYKIESVARTF
ncbi:MAG: translation initiation factor IF-2 [Planctomycetaceae bacterium]|nr:translation initiation factor IF-2 [Planctomycetaceae bacterium]